MDFNLYLGRKDDFIVENIGLAHAAARRYRSRCNGVASYEDLVSEGTIGLIKAFHQYNPNKVEGGTVKFSTYATPIIFGEIRRFLRDSASMVRPQRPLYETAGKIMRNNLLDLTAEEIAEVLELSLPLVKRTLHYLKTRQIVYLDQPSGASVDDEEISFLDHMSRMDDLSVILVKEFIAHLPMRQRQVAVSRLRGQTQKEIGRDIAVSQTQVSRLLGKIAEKLSTYQEEISNV